MTKSGEILEQKRWIQSTPNLVLLQKSLSFRIRRMAVLPFYIFPFYIRWGEEPSLPGLKYSPRQLFWISYARNWCSVRREAALKNQVDVESILMKQKCVL